MRGDSAGVVLAAAAVLTFAPAAAAAQTTWQVWGNVTLDWITTPRLTYELDFEPKVLISAPPGEPGWRNLDVTGTVEYAVHPTIDLIGEAIAGQTKQTDDLDSTELTVRAGARFHLFSRQERFLFREKLPKRRLVIRDLVRVEFRNLFYSGDQPTDSTVRFRNRLELLYPFNRTNLALDGAVYGIVDWEWFIPVSDPNERFANRQRIRTGVGVRRNESWRYVFLYMRTRSRDTIDESFATSENIINVQVKRTW